MCLMVLGRSGPDSYRSLTPGVRYNHERSWVELSIFPEIILYIPFWGAYHYGKALDTLILEYI
jgi:hypothetical protein